MSPPPSKRDPGGSPESGDSSKPKQASRSVCLLTPEQLARKRAQDRESQRHTRARVKQTITELEKRVEMLTQQLHLTRLENASLQVELAARGSIPTMEPPQPAPGPENFSEGIAAIMDVGVQDTSCHQQYIGVDSQFSNSLELTGHLSTAPAGHTLLDPSLFYLYEGFEQQPMSIPVWDARPNHYPATCKFDQACIDIIQTLKPFDAIGGNTFEFSNPNFPHVAAILNPQHYASSFPLTSAIVSNVIHAMTIQSLPEQMAMLYNMCTMLRWIISGTEEDYYAMPDWLRPGASQIVTAHPLWVDMMPWPKARDRLCRDAKYHHKFEAFKQACNHSMSINWPYEPIDTLIRTSPTEFSVNPVFVSHLRNINNWTVGPSFLELFPDFEGEVNIGKPRV